MHSPDIGWQLVKTDHTYQSHFGSWYLTVQIGHNFSKWTFLQTCASLSVKVKMYKGDTSNQWLLTTFIFAFLLLFSLHSSGFNYRGAERVNLSRDICFKHHSWHYGERNHKYDFRSPLVMIHRALMAQHYFRSIVHLDVLTLLRQHSTVVHTRRFTVCVSMKCLCHGKVLRWSDFEDQLQQLTPVCTKSLLK